MRLSNRCWRAIAYRMDDSPAEAMVWAKVESEAKGKRHYLRDIALNAYERIVVFDALISPHPDDHYMGFVIDHERATNPDFSLVQGV